MSRRKGRAPGPRGRASWRHRRLSPSSRPPFVDQLGMRRANHAESLVVIGQRDGVFRFHPLITAAVLLAKFAKVAIVPEAAAVAAIPADAPGVSILSAAAVARRRRERSEEHTSELQSLRHLVCRLLLEK